MNDSEKQLNVLPGLAAAALLFAVAALATAVVAIGKDNNDSSATTASMSGHAMAGMSSEDMGHMAPVSIAGIAKATADTDGTRLKGMLRNGVLNFTLDGPPGRLPVASASSLGDSSKPAATHLMPGGQTMNGGSMDSTQTHTMPGGQTMSGSDMHE